MENVIVASAVAEASRRKSRTDALLALFHSRPGAWIPVPELAEVAGLCAWRTRVSDARKRLIQAGVGDVCWNHMRLGKGVERGVDQPDPPDPPAGREGWIWHHEWQSNLVQRDGWMCETHPGQAWPHDDCAGPGMPWLIAGKANVLAALQEVAALAARVDRLEHQPPVPPPPANPDA